MHAIKTCSERNRNSITKLPLLLLAVAMLMIPVAGTGYVPILMTYAVFMALLWKDGGQLILDTSFLRRYAKYYFSFLCVSVVIGLLNGVGLYSEVADIVSSTVPFVSIYIGSKYAFKFPEDRMINTVFVLLMIEMLFGIGQTISLPFRQFSFELYGATNRLISYQAEDIGRAVGTIGSPNYYGILCVVLCVSVLPGCIEYNRKPTAFFVLTMGIICVVFSVSKTSVLCIGIAAVLWSLTNSKYRPSMKALLCLLTLLVVIIAIGEFESYSNRSFNLMTMSGRSNSWMRILSQFSDGSLFSQFFGYGNGYSTLKHFGVYADSFYIILLTEQGYVGTAAYIIVWLSLLFLSLRMPNRNYRQALIILVTVILMADVTAAITDNPNVAIVIYFMVGRYSKLAQCPISKEIDETNIS